MDSPPNKKHEPALSYIDRLCGVVAKLSSIVDRMDASESVVATEGSLPSALDPVMEEALQVRNERLRLVEAWTVLEAEQRAQALEPASECAKAIKPDRSEKLSTVKPPPNPLDQTSQFRLLQREYDRPRN